MAYYTGQSTIPVQPVTRRATMTRGQVPRNEQKFLQTNGRRPVNRRGYPVAGVPVPTTQTVGTWNKIPMSMEPGGRLGHYLPTDMELHPGRQLGGWFEDTIASMTKLSVPTVPSVATTPKAEPGFLTSLVTGAMNLWDQRPQVLKDLSFKVDPNVAMAAAQKLVSAGQVTKAVDYLRSVGINPSYLGIPVTGTTAGAAWTVGGMNIGSYLPWILGGGAVLILLPMLMGKRR